MPLYRYVKYHHHSPMRRSIIISLFFMSVGGSILMWAVWPILSFHFIASPIFALVTSPLGNSGKSSSDLVYAQSMTTSTQDYTNANTWFPLKPQKKVQAKVTAYKLSIPKLQIKNALVVIGGNDLNHEVVHYGGTAFPGENGNAAIFGHSVLPQFFDPKNYKTIFSTLPTLLIGDDILLTYDDVTYRYNVENITVRNPDDLSMLEQQYDDSYITLVTCVPPGTYWQRLHVRARLNKI